MHCQGGFPEELFPIVGMVADVRLDARVNTLCSILVGRRLQRVLWSQGN